MITRLGWRVYSVAALATRPHAFFARLAALDWYGQMLHAWVNGLDSGAPQCVLEVGCSGGALPGYLASRGHEVVAVDRSVRAVRFAKRSNSPNGSLPEFIAATAERLPLPDGHFDRVFAASLLNIVPDPLAVVAELVRVTAPEGLVSFLFPTARMSTVAARDYIRQHRLAGFSAAAISLWAAGARKLDEKTAATWLASEQLGSVRHDYFLGEMVCAISGRKDTRGGNASGRSQ